MKMQPGMALLLGLLAITPAAAGSARSEAAPAAATAATDTAAVTDFSAVRRKRKTVALAPGTTAAAPVQSGWQGPDPTRGAGMEQLRALQRDGRCVIDLGYGRYGSCNNE